MFKPRSHIQFEEYRHARTNYRAIEQHRRDKSPRLVADHAGNPRGASIRSPSAEDAGFPSGAVAPPPSSFRIVSVPDRPWRRQTTTFAKIARRGKSGGTVNSYTSSSCNLSPSRLDRPAVLHARGARAEVSGTDRQPSARHQSTAAGECRPARPSNSAFRASSERASHEPRRWPAHPARPGLWPVPERSGDAAIADDRTRKTPPVG